MRRGLGLVIGRDDDADRRIGRAERNLLKTEVNDATAHKEVPLRAGMSPVSPLLTTGLRRPGAPGGSWRTHVGVELISASLSRGVAALLLNQLPTFRATVGSGWHGHP